MYLIGDKTADVMVRALTEREGALEAQLKRLRGPEFAGPRANLREQLRQTREAMAGINTGDGVTRKSAAEMGH